MTDKHNITDDDIYHMALNHLGCEESKATRLLFNALYPTVKRLTDGVLSNPQTVRFLAFKMALEMCIPLTGDQKKFNELKVLLNVR